MNATIRAIEYYLPDRELTNEGLSILFPGRSPEELAKKTGVWSRHVSAPEQCSSDLGVAAAQKLFATGPYTPEDIDFILFCTQTPDYFFPATACLVQDRLGISIRAGALDFNLGCSGYIYGLGLANGLIQTGQANRVLLVTADVVTKFIDESDRTMRALIGDGATATIIERTENDDRTGFDQFIYGTDGRGADHLMIEGGALRDFVSHRGAFSTRGTPIVQMKGQKLVEFAAKTVPRVLQTLMSRCDMQLQDVDFFVFHQASRYILELLAQILKIPNEKSYSCLSECGNTVASTIPIALKRASDEEKLCRGAKVVLCGFGVGLSWGAALVTWSGLRVGQSRQMVSAQPVIS